MKSSVTFSATIPRPCQQSWDEMSPSGNGKHCSNCQKKIIDFSMLTDAEVVNVFNGSSQKICGRFNASQLNRMLDKQDIKRNTFPVITLTTLLIISIPSKSAARPVIVPFTHAPFAMPAALGKIPLLPANDTTGIITGQLIDSIHRDGLPGVAVMIKGTSYGTATDAAGNFRLRIPDSLHRSGITLVFSCIGFTTKELLVKDSGPLTIALNQQDKALLGEVVITCRIKPTFRERMKLKWARLRRK